MTLNMAALRTALRTQLLTLAGLDSAQVAWEGRPFTPTLGTAWWRELLKPAGAQLQTLGPQGRIRTEGTLFLDYFAPSAGVGMQAIDAAPDAMVALFAPALELVSGGQKVTVREASRLAPVPEVNWIMVPVRVRWFTDTFNTI